jgi:hypothetical protein
MTATFGVFVLGARRRLARAGVERKVMSKNDSKKIVRKRNEYARAAELIMA